MKELRIGIISYGFMGKAHTFGYQSIPLYYDSQPCRIKLVGICDADESLCKKATEQAGFEFYTTDYNELIARKDIDVVDCCAPNLLHKDILIKAMQAGKHINTEKPLAMNLKEAKEIIEIAKKSNVKNAITFEYRFIPAIMRAKQLIDEGLLGDVSSFRAMDLHDSCVIQKKAYSWKAEYDKVGGGVLVDLGPHPLDLLRYLLGEFKSVNAFLKNFTSPDKRTDDLALVNIKMQNGAIGTLEVSKMATGTNDELRIEISGSKGALKFNSMDPNYLEFYNNTEVNQPIGGKKGFKKIETVQRYPEPAVFPNPKFPLGWSRYIIASQYNFLDSIVNNKENSPNLYDGYKIQEVIDACYLSNKKKEWVNLLL